MSKIQWTNKTWNPISGCSIISPGCTHCYAMRMAKRLGNIPATRDKYAGLTNERGQWTGEIRLVPEELDRPNSWKKPQRIFVCSMADLFHDDVPFEFIDKIWDVMERCRCEMSIPHIFQILTKRPKRLFEYNPYPMSNVWLGVSVENKEQADKRIPILLDIPAAVRFLSIEPLLEDLGQLDLTGISQVIVGGESGPGSRPCHPDWIRSIRDQCIAADVPFFFKQWGEWVPCTINESYNPKNMIWFDSKWENRTKMSFSMARVGKKKAGRTLDGRTWDEYPAGREEIFND